MGIAGVESSESSFQDLKLLDGNLRALGTGNGHYGCRICPNSMEQSLTRTAVAVHQGVAKENRLSTLLTLPAMHYYACPVTCML